MKMSDMTNHPVAAKRAVIHRMVMPSHTCPYGLKAVDLLKRSGFEVEDHHLTTREETDAFKAAHGVATASASAAMMMCAGSLVSA
jgi:glutaredoxin